MKHHGLIVLLVVLGTSRAADAQPAIDVRASFGAFDYQQGDLAAPAVRFALRAGGRRFAIEPELALAWRSTTGGSHQFRNLGVNAIARARGRVAPFFGGGIGMYSERWRSTADGPVRTQSFGPRVGTQIVFGLDMHTTRHLAVFGQGRFETRSFGDSGGGSVFQGFAGVAISLRGARRAPRNARPQTNTIAFEPHAITSGC